MKASLIFVIVAIVVVVALVFLLQKPSLPADIKNDANQITTDLQGIVIIETELPIDDLDITDSDLAEIESLL